jgi:cell division protein FtsL
MKKFFISLSKSKANPLAQSSRATKQASLLVILLAAVFGSAIGLVYTTLQSRHLFNELQQQQKEQDQLQVEWGQLLLEQSTWSGELRIERIASEKLKMVRPDIKDKDHLMIKLPSHH